MFDFLLSHTHNNYFTTQSFFIDLQFIKKNISAYRPQA